MLPHWLNSTFNPNDKPILAPYACAFCDDRDPGHQVRAQGLEGLNGKCSIL